MHKNLLRRHFLTGIAVLPALLSFSASAEAQTLARLGVSIMTKKKKIVLGILGDSTGNEQWEWVYQLAKWLGEKTKYSIDYCVFSDATNTYGPVERIHEGDPGKAILIYNCSVPGKGFNYPTKAPRTISSVLPEAPDVTVLSYGYNHLSAGSEFGEKFRQLALDVTKVYPSTQIVFVAQPPKAPGSPDAVEASLRSGSVRAMATKYGYVLIDANAAFENSGKLKKLISDDGIHPNKDGQKVWFEAAKKAFSTGL